MMKGPIADNPPAIPVQGKFGVLENLEGSMAARYLVNDSSGNTGLDRPVLALKYADPKTGGGGFLAVSLPVGFEDVMNAGNYATMTFGAMYGSQFPYVNLLANASYSFNTEDNNDNKMDNLRLFAKPEYPLNVAWFKTHKQRLGLSLAAIYEYPFQPHGGRGIRGRRRPSLPAGTRGPVDAEQVRQRRGQRLLQRLRPEPARGPVGAGAALFLAGRGRV